MDLLPERYTVVTATIDSAAGVIGTIYQACGFDYVGPMGNGGCSLVRVNGKTMSERQAGRLFGTRGSRALAKLGPIRPEGFRPRSVSAVPEGFGGVTLTGALACLPDQRRVAVTAPGEAG